MTHSKKQPHRLIQGRKCKKGEQLLGTWQGNIYDQMFKGRLRWELKFGELKKFAARLECVSKGSAGPDVFLKGSPMIAWDVTTQKDIEKHIWRDSIERFYNRYYLLIWDEPRTKPTRILKALAGNSCDRQ